MSFNVQSILEDYGIEFWVSGKNVADGFVNVTCPYCQDRSNHGGFSKNGNVYMCWRCGKHNVVDTLIELTGLKARQIFELKDKYNILIDDEEEKIEYYNDTIEVPGSKLLPQHINYLESRLFDAKYLENKYDLRGTLYTGDLYAYRVIAPIYYNNRIVSYQGRDFTRKQNIKYATCKPENEIVHHKKILFNLDNAKNDSVIVVEGIYDVFRFGDDTIATMGTSYTKEQLVMLAKRYKTIYTMFDPEKPAQERAKKLCYDLSLAGIDTVNLFLDDGDPAEQTEETVRLIKKDLNL